MHRTWPALMWPTSWALTDLTDADAKKISALVKKAAALANRDKPARDIVNAIFGAMQAFRGDADQNDDQTCVVVKITT